MIFNKIFRYSNKVKEKMIILRDRPIKPIEYAIYWIEFVIRNKGAKYFHNAGQKLHWIQLYLIDVIVFSVLVLLIKIKIIMFLCKLCLGNKSIQKNSTEKKQQ